MIIVDTSVVSEVMRAAPASAVLAWFGRQSGAILFLTTIGEAELRAGVALLPEGRRRVRACPRCRDRDPQHARFRVLRRSADRPLVRLTYCAV